MSSDKRRRANHTKSFLHDDNVDKLFQKLYNDSLLAVDERDDFREFMRFTAEKNANRGQLDLKTMNKFVETKFEKLWKLYKREAQKKAKTSQEPSENFSQPTGSNNNEEYFDTITTTNTRRNANIGTGNDQGTRRRRNRNRGGENFMPPNGESDRHNFMDEGVDYRYIGNPPGAVNYENRRVPFDYQNQLQPPRDMAGDFQGQVFGIKSKYAKKGHGIADGDVGDVGSSKDDLFFGPPLDGPGAALATDDSGNPYDQNVTLARGLTDSRVEQEYVFPIDSRLRDVLISPNANSYKVSLTELLGKEFGFIRELRNGLNNIFSIELIQATIPNIIRESTVQHYEPYLYLDIDEISGNIRTMIDDPTRVFAQLYYINSDTIRDTPHLTLTPANCCKTYPRNNMLKDIKNLTIRFYNFDGALFDFGEDAPPLVGVTQGNPTIFETASPHGMTTGERVYIRGFSSGDPDFDTEVNRTKGFIIAVNTLDTFQVELDTLGMPDPAAFGNVQNNVTLRFRIFSTDIGN